MHTTSTLARAAMRCRLTPFALFAAFLLLLLIFHRREAGQIRVLVKDECEPLAVPVEQQCAYVKEHCSAPNTFLHIKYLRNHFCSSLKSRPAHIIGLLVWLGFLFSTLGISASDFFCPNLASLSHALGLDENVAGVTFLAFGNGSPDLFSTFSAFKADSGSLAIGELLGAATFITSVVVGSMAIVKPFQVNKAYFLRDVGFFTVSICLVLFILHDGVIQGWEAGVLVGLYAVYVVYVVVGTWWENRRARKRILEERMRSVYTAEEMPEPYFDDPDVSRPSMGNLSPGGGRSRALSLPDRPQMRLETSSLWSHTPSGASTPNSITMSQSTPHLQQLPSFSLVGALEFRSVIQSLHRQSARGALETFEGSPLTTPVSPFVRAHLQSQSAHPHRRQSTASASPYDERQREVDPWDRALRQQSSSVSLEPMPPIPAITLQGPDSSTSSPVEVDAPPPPPPKASRWKRIARVLFPTLVNFTSRRWIDRLVGMFAAPAVLALTLTLPVVVTPFETHGHHIEKPFGEPEARLIDFEEEGVERALVAEEDVQEELHDVNFNKWLTATQCVLGPLFSVAVLFSESKHVLLYLLIMLAVGLSAAVLILIFANRGNDESARLARCMLGFTIAVVWIMAIADEVVGVLKTFGELFGLSDAIIGLTIFAIGNSLADFVADLSVASFAPVMAFSACFGGPMLNILLGVGLSGSWVVNDTKRPFELTFSPTLLVSTIGLLILLIVTMVFVPWNGYMITRTWGIFLIVFYVVILAINVAVEISRGRG